MKKTVRLLIVIILASAAGFPVLAEAVSFSPVPEEREEKSARGIMEKGAMVCLFQSGTAEVKKTINIGDVLTAYREGPKHELTAVGKIKVLSYAGDDYLRGEIVEGGIAFGDIAKKSEVASMVISPGDKCR